MPAGGRHDILMDRGRTAVFVGFDEYTTRHYWLYAPDLGYYTKSSRVEFDEGSRGDDVQLHLRRKPTASDSNTGTSNGTLNELQIRKPRGRPKLGVNLNSELVDQPLSAALETATLLAAGGVQGDRDNQQQDCDDVMKEPDTIMPDLHQTTQTGFYE